MIATMLLLSSSLVSSLSFIADGSGQAQDVPTEIMPPGDWVVAAPESRSDEVIVLNGNLIITNAGVLELTNVTLIMNVTVTHGDYGITVRDGGRFYVNDTDGNPATLHDRSLITNNATFGKGYTFQVNETATFEMRNSRLDNCTLATTHPDFKTSGPRILSDDVLIENSVISNCANGLYVDSANPAIINTTVQFSSKHGIFLANARDPDHHFDLALANNTVIQNGETGIFLQGNVTDIALEENKVNDNGQGGILIVSDYSLNATVADNTVQSNSLKGGIGMWGIPGTCVIRANFTGNNISFNEGFSPLRVGVETPGPPSRAVFLNASGNDIWISDYGDTGIAIVYASDYIYANLSGNNFIGPQTVYGVNIGAVMPDTHESPACKVVDAILLNNEIVNKGAGALKVTSTELLTANVTGNHIHHPSGEMICGSVSLGWYAAKMTECTPGNASVVVRDNIFEGISDSGALGIKAIWNLDAVIENNVVDRVNEWGFKLGWIDDDDVQKLSPLLDGSPTRNVRAIIRNNTIGSGWGPGVLVYSSNGSSIHGNRISGLRYDGTFTERTDGIHVKSPKGPTSIFNNTISDCKGTIKNEVITSGMGIRLSQSSGVSVHGNNLDNNFCGLGVESNSSDNTFFDNAITKAASKYGFYVSTDSLSHTFPENNTVNGNGNWFRYYNGLHGTPAAHQTITNQDIQVPQMSNLGQLVLVNSTYVDVTDNIVNNGTNGIVLIKSNHTLIQGNSLANNKDYYTPAIVGSGIRLGVSSHNNTIAGNDILHNLYGIKFEHSNVDNTVMGNDFLNNGYGIRFGPSSVNNDMWENTMSKSSSQTAIYLDPAGTTWRNDMPSNNTVDGSQLHYYFDKTNVQVKDQTINEPLMTNVGQFIILNSRNVLLENIAVYNGTYGLYISTSENLTMKKSDLRHNTYNLYCHASKDLLLDGITVSNGAYGLHMVASDNASLVNSNIDSNTYNLNFQSNTNVFLDNIAVHNGTHGLRLGASDKLTLMNSLIGSNTYNLNLQTSTNVHMENLELQGGMTSVQLASTSPTIFNSTIGQATALSFNITDGNCHPVLLNTTYDQSHANISAGSDITVRWFLDFSVLAKGMPCMGANVTIMDSTGAVKYNLTTDSNNEFTDLILLGHLHTSTDPINISAYSVIIQKEGFADFTEDFMMNSTKTLTFNLTDKVAPALTSISLEPASSGTSAHTVWLNATFSDIGVGDSTIAGAEWYISDAIPTIVSGTGFFLPASDGAFDEVIEETGVLIDIDNWQVGEYTIWAHGKDSGDNWCDWSSATFTIYDDEGPVATVGPTVDSTVSISKKKVSVITVMDDTGYGNSRIMSVEWSIAQGNDTIIDSSNILATTRVVDGKYDEVNETIEAVVDTMFWDIGDYTFRIRGFDEFGNIGPWHTTVFRLVDDIAPSSPANLIATGAEFGIELTWSANNENDLAGYNIYRANDSGGPYSLICSVNSSSTSWLDANTEPDNDYYYVLVAFDSATPPNQSPYSNEARGKRAAAAAEEPESSIPLLEEAIWWVLIPVIIILFSALVIQQIRKIKRKRARTAPDEAVEGEPTSNGTDEKK
ncbi:MAG: right-handed parallel beta-helix repeat-containing protein [Thermoplasmata archaeon]